MASNAKKILSGSSNLNLAEKISRKLKTKLGGIHSDQFPDGEWSIWIDEDVNNAQVFIIQPTSPPANSSLMELCLISDALRREGARRICAVIPYFGYARQERRSRGGEPISAKVAADLLVTSGVTKVITVDLHAEAIVGFFNVPVVHLSATKILGDRVKKEHLRNPVVVSPDVGGVRRARNFAYYLGYPIAVIEKRRFFEERDKAEVLSMGGDVAGKSAIIIDDLISTGGTIVENAKILKQAGVKNIITCATHPVFVGKYKENFEQADIEKVIVTDSISVPEEKKFKNLEIVSCSGVIAEAIKEDDIWNLKKS
ncbi:MAG: ribose-phosphate diphosphokinase [Candidatus Woykebacteria bacterium]